MGSRLPFLSDAPSAGSAGEGPHTSCLPSWTGQTGPCISRGGVSLVLFAGEEVMTLVQLTLEHCELEARGSTWPRVFPVNTTQSAVV